MQDPGKSAAEEERRLALGAAGRQPWVLCAFCPGCFFGERTRLSNDMASDARKPTDQDDSHESPEGDSSLLLSPIGEILAPCLETLEKRGNAALDQLCEQHPEHAESLRRRVHHLREAGFLPMPRALGPYELYEPLGSGGMGIVHLAHDPRMNRLVAIKKVPGWLAQSEKARARFEREVKAVAQLRHPHIVPVYDVGEDEESPYFVMEFVKGSTLALVLDKIRETKETVESLTTQHLVAALGGPPHPVPAPWGQAYVQAVAHLTLEVAQALHHAHQHGIVHRDVKPSNVLVRSDGRGLLFDFGLARVDDQEPLTLTGDFTGTPHYMAPEQVAGRAELAGDPRADVYSLGVTLFELLTLRRPFEGSSTASIFRQIQSASVPLPRKFNPLIPKDLETICLTAMEKNPDKRYQSAREFAEDLQRFLAYKPVQARPIGPTVRSWRWVRRNPSLAAAGFLGVCLAVGIPGGILSANFAIRAEADRALAESQKAQQINRFLDEMISAADPRQDGPDVKVAELLDRAAERLGVELQDAPLVQAALRQTLGRTYLSLGLTETGREQLTMAAGLLREQGGAEEDLAFTLNLLGVACAKANDLAQAEKCFQESRSIRANLPDSDQSKLSSCLTNLSHLRILQNDLVGAEEFLREAVGLSEVRGGVNLANTLTALAEVLIRKGNRKEAESLLLRSLKELQERASTDVPARMLQRRKLGNFYAKGNSYETAEAHLKRAVQLGRERLPSEHPDLSKAWMDLGDVLGKQGKSGEASQAFQASLDSLLAHPQPDRLTMSRAHHQLALAAEVDQSWEISGKAILDALSELRRLSGDLDPRVASLLNDAMRILFAAEHFDALEVVLLEFEEIYRNAFGEAHWFREECLVTLAEIYEATGDESSEQRMLEKLGKLAAPEPRDHALGDPSATE